MMDDGYKRNIIDHVEIVDEIPEANDLATDTENRRNTSTESSILSIDNISKLFKVEIWLLCPLCQMMGHPT